MEQAIILIWGFMGPAIAVCIVGIIYGLYDNKRRRGTEPAEPKAA